MKRYEPFCGFPYGFHEIEDIDGPRCVHCGDTLEELVENGKYELDEEEIKKYV